MFIQNLKKYLLILMLRYKKIVNRSLERYTSDEEFKNSIDNYTDLQASGSQF